MTTAVSAAPAVRSHVNVAFFNGDKPPVDALQAFDAVVLEPSSHFQPVTQKLAHTTWVARIAPSASASPAEIVAQEVEPLWARGYRGFLLDNAAAIAAFDAISTAHPDARLLVGGPDALNAALAHARSTYAVLGQPLASGWDEQAARIVEVPAAERATRAAAAQAFMRQTGVPVLSLEFCERADRQCARRTAIDVVSAGVTPYVTDPGRDVVGIGAIEVLPRKVLVVQDTAPDLPLDLTPGVRNLAMPLNYLGYDVEYVNVNERLPDDITPDRYAGVVAWLEGVGVRDANAWRRWVDARVQAHVPIAFVGQFGFEAAADEGAALDLSPVAGPFSGQVETVMRDAMIGFEIDPGLDARDVAALKVGAASRPLLRARVGGATVDQAAITPWGGFALSPYTVVPLTGIEQERWAIQPIAFLKEALRLPAMPSPSVTTENGRRLLMVHVDGDGFASRAEFPGVDYSGDALYNRIFTRYRIPMTLSVIEGEVGPAGRYPELSPRLEVIARKMFALPYVEIGTHTYSHPFDWTLVDATTGARIDRGGGDTAFSIEIPNYKFNIDREIRGSIDYINTRLAPPGKQTAVLQWPGNCQPPEMVVHKVYEAGVANINGGDTVITKRASSWTNIAPIGVDKGPGAYQIYAPNQDENVYTNDWLGPFYGFTRVLETYAMTDEPLRFKPIDIYFHMYSGTKIASLRALDEIFSNVLKQPVLPLHVTDYTNKVLDWRSFAVAREVEPASNRWIVRGDGAVRELHWPGSTVPDLQGASGVTGFATGPDGTYIHIDGGAAAVSLDSNQRGSAAPASSASLPYIAEANGFVRHFVRKPHALSFEFGGYYQPFIKLASARSCRATVAGKPVAVRRDGGDVKIDMPATEGQRVEYRLVEIDCEH
ncbi:sugar ABC transporter [Trinickia sp. LjRoot230]|uniref:polysaccharide deacetylase family protein n=1 Tax=Trinickia sp. LjRoot230 TaxID=3342288 RepID=UPI003ECEAD95